MNQITMGNEFATNRNLSIPMGDGKGKKGKLFTEEQIADMKEKARLRKLGQQDMFRG